MDWAKKHVDTVIILGGILSSFLWMNAQLNNLNKEMSDLKKELAIVKTVLIMKEIMPRELAISED